MEDCGTRNAIFILRMMSERGIEVKKDLYVCFLDYAKAFDTVKHAELMKILEEIQLDGKDLRIIRNLYWNQSAAIRIGNDVGDFVTIEKGVRQGCVFSPDLFNIYGEWILREIEDHQGIVIGGSKINNLRYADDTVLIAGSEKDLQKMVNKVESESKKMGLLINHKKTECMVITKKKVIPTCNIWIGDNQIKQVTHFNYLGSLITSDGRCEKEIRKRIALAKSIFWDMKNILCDLNMSMTTKLRVLDCYVLPVLTYGSEGWTMTKVLEDKLNAVEMWFLRRMLRIPWVSHTSNEAVLQKAGRQRVLLRLIRKRQLSFLGHCLRKEGLEKLVLTGKIEGRRDRGRQRTTFMGSLANHVGMTTTSIIHAAHDRKYWHHLVANVT